jgi:hypothetical protein
VINSPQSAAFLAAAAPVIPSFPFALYPSKQLPALNYRSGSAAIVIVHACRKSFPLLPPGYAASHADQLAAVASVALKDRSASALKVPAKIHLRSSPFEKLEDSVAIISNLSIVFIV